MKLRGTNWKPIRKPAPDGGLPFVAYAMTIIGAPIFCEVWKPGPRWRWEVFSSTGATLAAGECFDARYARRQALIAARRFGRELERTSLIAELAGKAAR